MYASSCEITSRDCASGGVHRFHRDGPIPRDRCDYRYGDEPEQKSTARAPNVVARDIDTNREATAMTDDDGRFRIVGLHPGQGRLRDGWIPPPYQEARVAHERGAGGTRRQKHALRPDCLA